MLFWKAAKLSSDADQEPEICLNLWWIREAQTGLVYRLAGRAYALTGTDEHKMQILHSLAPTDFHISRLFPLPKRFKVISSGGELEGVTEQSIIVQHHADVFEHVFKGLELDLATQMRSISGRPVTYTLCIPQDPLCVTTCVQEFEDGRLVPQVSRKPA